MLADININPSKKEIDEKTLLQTLLRVKLAKTNARNRKVAPSKKANLKPPMRKKTSVLSVNAVTYNRIATNFNFYSPFVKF
jgi:hypothetical protein